MQRTTTSDDVVGASIVHPGRWVAGPERHTYDGTYGFTLWKPNPARSRYHGRTPVARVSLAHDLRPEQLETKVQEKLSAYSNLLVTREHVRVGERNLEGVAVGPIPGSTPSTEVYVALDEQVYQINVYGERLDAQSRELLSSLKFYPPSGPVDSLGLLDATAPQAFTVRDERHDLQQFVELEVFAEREREAQAAGRQVRSAGEALRFASQYQT
jgi:hypothetical protein